MRYTIFCLLSLLSICANAQSSFTRIFQQDTANTSSYVYGYCVPVQPTADGGYLLQYYSGQVYFDGGGYDFPLLIKTDSAFVPQWKKKLLSAVAFKDSSFFDTQMLFDTCVSLERRNLNGNIIWQKSLAWSAGTIHTAWPVYANAKIRLLAGAMNFSGSAAPYYQAFFVDIDSTGALLGANAIDGDTSSWEHIFADDSGNYYFITKGLYDGSNRRITKVLPDNTVAWSNVLEVDLRYNITALLPLPGSGFILGGNYRAGVDTAAERMFMIRFNAAGAIVWQKSAARLSRMSDMQLQKNGNILIAAGGVTNSAFSNIPEDNIIVTDTAANVLWSRNMDVDRASWPYYTGISLPYCKGGNWYFSAVTAQPYAAMVLNTDSLGFGHCPSASTAMSFYDTALFTLTPSTLSLSPIALTITDYVLADTVQPQTFTDSCDYAPPLSTMVQHTSLTTAINIYPNPANGSLYVEGYAMPYQLTICSINGQRVYDQTLQSAGTKIDVSGWAHGAYMVRICSTSGLPVCKKIVIVN